MTLPKSDQERPMSDNLYDKKQPIQAKSPDNPRSEATQGAIGPIQPGVTVPN